MTSNSSPVYTYLQPDRTGQRPAELEMLQYARPDDIQHSPTRLDQRRNTSIQEAGHYSTPFVAQHGTLRHSNEYTAGARHTMSLNSSGAHINVISGGGDYTSSESENTQRRSSRPPLVSSLVWYCCRSGCPYRGPYSFELYADCTLGCGTPRCTECPQEVIVTRDREAPVRSR